MSISYIRHASDNKRISNSIEASQKGTKTSSTLSIPRETLTPLSFNIRTGAIEL
jgi:hypothetical protein